MNPTVFSIFYHILLQGQNHSDPSKCVCSTYLICGNTKSKNQTDAEFKLWKESKLETVVNHVEYPSNGSALKGNESDVKEDVIREGNINNYIGKPRHIWHKTKGQKDDKVDISTEEVKEDVLKETERDIEDESILNEDENALLALLESYKNVNEHSEKHANRHIDNVDKDDNDFVIEGFELTPKINNVDNPDKGRNQIPGHSKRIIDRHVDADDEPKPIKEQWYSSKQDSYENTISNGYADDNKGNMIT